MGTSVPLTEDEIENINCLFSNLDTKISIYLSRRNEPVIDAQHMSLFFWPKHFITMEKQSFNIVYFKQILALDLDEGSGLFFSMYCLKMHELSVNLSGTLHHPKYFIHD